MPSGEYSDEMDYDETMGWIAQRLGLDPEEARHDHRVRAIYSLSKCADDIGEMAGHVTRGEWVSATHWRRMDVLQSEDDLLMDVGDLLSNQTFYGDDYGV